MKRSLVCLVAALTCATSTGADLSCAGQIGQRLATLVAEQCRQVSPATHPPCNAANSCATIIDELEQACMLVSSESPRRKFCATKERAGSFEGYLFGVRGIDSPALMVMTDKGDRIIAYCLEQCDALLGPPDFKDAVALRKGLVGKRVAVEVAFERNGDPLMNGEKEGRIAVIKRVKLLK